MTRIGIISDTHGYLDKGVLKHFKDCDQIWHAGDIGNLKVVDQLQAFKPLKAVWGNIDGAEARGRFPEVNNFKVEDVSVTMMHIAGYPGRYNPAAREAIQQSRPNIFICGHSHILKVMKDDKYGHLHMNPGAAGMQGFHKTKTLLRFVIDGSNIQNLEVVELGKRAISNPV